MTDAHAHDVAHAPKHPYHLVDPSPWPILGAVAAGLTTMGAVMFMHGGWPWLLPLGFILILLTMFLWFRDVVREGTYLGFHTPIVQLGLRYGMMLFIASEVMFFSAFFWAYFDSSLYPKEAVGFVWPPSNIRPFNPFELPLLNTLILLTSGVTVTWAHHALRENDRAGMLQGLALTILLGITFTCVQAYEYTHAAFGFRDNNYTSTFFLATGFHGFHVFVGTTFLLVCLFRAMKGQFKPNQHFGFEAAAWYWHFVDVVWIFLFFCIYWWGAGNAPIAHH
jgi:cytochrome c oxidase subunit 3